MKKVFVVLNEDDGIVGVTLAKAGWEHKLLEMVSDEVDEEASYAKGYKPTAPDTLNEETVIQVQLDEFEYEVRMQLAAVY